MVPGISHEGTGVYLLRTGSCIPEHALLNHNGDYGSYKCQDTGNFKVAVVAMGNYLNTGISDTAACKEQQICKYYRSNTFKSVVTILVLLVGSSSGYTYSYYNDNGTQYV